jgi:polysaccharide export outer membrane protein
MRYLICILLALVVGPLFADDPQTTAAPAAPAEDPAASYIIGVEDALRVVVWGEPELSVAVKVRPDGQITVPLVNDITVVGLTPMQVREVIMERLGTFIRDPNVTVIVDEINSFRVYFLGEVTMQGAIRFSKPPRLLQAIAAAGGLTEFSKREVILLRKQGPTEKRFVINYKHLVAGDPREENLYLKPGDTLIFP